MEEELTPETSCLSNTTEKWTISYLILQKKINQSHRQMLDKIIAFRNLYFVEMFILFIFRAFNYVCCRF